MSTANITLPEPAAQRIVIPVSGMTCAACQGRVQRTLSKTPGVLDASVNLMMGNATVSFDSDAINAEQLVETIRSTGYGASLPVADRSAVEEQTARDRETEQEFHALRAKAIVSAIIGVIAMMLSMPLMASDHSASHDVVSYPFMRWAME